MRTKGTYNKITKEYSDTFVSVINDNEKMLVIFVTDNGQAKVISYDDNFFYVEILIETYLEMLLVSFKRWGFDTHKEEIKKHVKKFLKHMEKRTEIDRELFSEELTELLK